MIDPLALSADEFEAAVQTMLSMIVSEPAPGDDEYELKRWRATRLLMEQAHDWTLIARDESLLDGVRVFAAERARCIREEMRPV